jgi:Domain of unknown function (DUF6378)
MSADTEFVKRMASELGHYKEATAVAEKQASEYRLKLKDYEDMMRGHEQQLAELQLQALRAKDGMIPVKEAMPLTFGEHVNTTLQERGSKYGPFIGHAQVTQDLKRVITNALSDRGKDLIEDQQEALDMICHKIGRIVNGDANYDDSWRDIAGYAMLVCNRLTDKGPQ